MTHLLHIDTSPRGARSHTRRLTREFVDLLEKVRPSDTVTYRDVGRNPPPPVDEAWIAAAFTAPEERTRQMKEALLLSDALVDEFTAADTYSIGVPMYNFAMPSSFKAYIDQIVRVGRTFAFEPEDAAQPYKPLVHGKKMFVFVATGDSGYERGERYEMLNHLDPYLRTVFGFIGVHDITFVHLGNDEFGGQRLAQSVAHARERIAGLIAA